MAAKTCSISELARELAVTTRFIRCYEEQGLFTPKLLDIQHKQLERYTAEERCRAGLQPISEAG